jgi:hypothetical protein
MLVRRHTPCPELEGGTIHGTSPYFWSQGCSGVELQRLLTASGFRLFLTAHALDKTRCNQTSPPASARGSPPRSHLQPVSPDRLHYGSNGRLPYNIYAIHCSAGAAG